MSSATPNRSKATDQKISSSSSKDRSPIDPNVFRADIERHQMKIHQGLHLRRQLSSLGESSEPTKPKKKDPSKRQKRKKRHSFIKIKAGEINSEHKHSPVNQSKRILVLKLPNGIELEFWS